MPVDGISSYFIRSYKDLSAGTSESSIIDSGWVFLSALPCAYGFVFSAISVTFATVVVIASAFGFSLASSMGLLN